MAETAAHLVDHVVPDVRVRQWVLDAALRAPSRRRLYTEALELELEHLDPAVDLAIATTGSVVWGHAPAEFLATAEQAMRTNGPAWDDLGSVRVLAIPTYDELDRIVGAVLASTSRSPAQAAMLRFSVATGAASLLLIGLGIATSRRNSQRVLAATLARIAERERILAGAAHELQTPLAAVLAVSESTHGQDAERALEQVRETTRTASAMLRRLLAWSQLSDGRIEAEPVRLDLLVESCLEDDDPFDAEATIVDGDPRLLAVLVRNLVENARVHGGGLRSVRVRDRRLVVEDERGAPIDPALLSPFVKGQSSSGSGLGLVLVQRIATLHLATLELGPPVVVDWGDGW